MADKISTIVLKVDLECDRCYRKIRRVLCKIQDKYDIKTISFNEKDKSVTISGPMDTDRVCKKLCCEASRIIKDMEVKGNDGGDKQKPAAAAGKPADKEGGKPETAKEGKAEKEAKPEKVKDAKPEKAKDGKPDKESKKVTFEDAKPKADLGPLLEKIMAANNNKPGPQPKPIAQSPVMAPAAAQGVAVPSMWPAPAGSVPGYSYNPSYEPPPNYGGYSYGYGCGCGGGGGYCRCGGKQQAAAGGYYGVPVYDSQGWYGQQPYYQQQQCCEDPNAGCSVM